MPSKCIADKKLKDAGGNEFVGFQVFGGKHIGQYKQGETYPEDFLAHKWKFDFEHVDAEPPGDPPIPKAKNKPNPKDSGGLKSPQNGGDE